ncbi:MAG: class II aldolase/adducin family protein [Planctomycetota bacterium]|jgi:L-fuculose-phosphate aldolase|nr:class II aldolase/adducin family protein [Planctomycetota bacterium]
MNYEHPRELLTQTLRRLYDCGMTTTSGGNLSVRDAEGNIWITPSRIDKATLRPDDIVKITPQGEARGRHAPSCELPFHRLVYAKRADARAVLHAHSPAITAFCLVGQTPNVELLPGGKLTCGKIASVGYATPGSEKLAELVAAELASGADAVLMANHGVAAVGKNLAQAFARVEALNFIAQMQINATNLGETAPFLRTSAPVDWTEFVPPPPLPLECEIRADIAVFCARAYRQRLIFSGHSFFAARLGDAGDDDFLITPTDYDPQKLTAAEIVRVKDGKREAGKRPARSARLFREIFRQHPWTGAVAIARSPAVTTFALTKTPLDCRAIPESYMVLRDVPLVSSEICLDRPAELVAQLNPARPALMIENYGLLATGKNLAEVFDRLEVAEFTARALLAAQRLGKPQTIGDAPIAEIVAEFKLPSLELRV